VALHYADGSTVCDSGDCLAIAPGCTFHVKDLYPFIYSGFGKVCHYMIQPLVELYGGCMVVLKVS
jgi:hypothetical protein